MAFSRETNLTKDSIQDIWINFFSPGPDNTGGIQYGEITFQVKLSDGETVIKKADLLARLGDDAAGGTHLANLAALRTYIRTRLNNEVLPTP